MPFIINQQKPKEKKKTSRNYDIFIFMAFHTFPTAAAAAATVNE